MWQKITVEVGNGRFANGEWRVTEDEFDTWIEFRSNGHEAELSVSPALPLDGCVAIAELLIKGLNAVRSVETA